MTRWTFIIAFVLLPLRAEATILFLSGFETADLEEWATTLATPTVPSSDAQCPGSTPPSGAYMMKVAANAAFLSDLAITSSFNQAELYIRTRVGIDAAPTGLTPFLVMNDVPNTHNLFSLRLGTDRKISWAFNTLVGAAVATGSTVLSTNTWYRLEAHALVAGGGAGGVEWKLYDAAGSLLETVTSFSTTTDAFGNIGVVNVGSATTTNSGATHLCFDDVQIRTDAYPGDGHIIARQTTSGTPTYDAWTKNGCASIDLCWNNIPITTGTSASSTTAAQAQTMLVHSFSTTQTGHGTEIIDGNDLINAAQIVGVGIASSGGTTVKVRRRLGGSDTDTTSRALLTALIATTRAGNGVMDCCWTTTFTNLNSMEAGFVQNANTVTQTIYDTFVVVDFLAQSSVVKHRVYQQ